ncbi:MAG TPA: VWA domain-containing protein [Bacteroidia bacterium]|jgi:Ca-activated chloride channel family protein|nr:VWA domain-containing protein [Bacteroidia bacterium]
MLRFENIHYLYALGLIPLCILLFLVTSAWKKRMIRRFGDTVLVLKLIPDISAAKRISKFLLFLTGLACIILVVLNPQAGSKLQEVKRRGARIIIALDVSNSMKAEDLQPNRLESAKRDIGRLIDNLQGDEIGLIVFAGKAYVQLPITSDYAAAKLFLDNIDTDLAPTQGTSISSAIDLAVESFGEQEGKNKALIIITDGEDHEGEVVEAAAKAAKKDIVIHTIGLGSPSGVPIPVYQGKKFTGYRKDREGATIITKLNEQVLKEIATAGHGLYIHATNADIGLRSLMEEISRLDKTDFQSKIYTDYDDYFPYFAWLALLILILELLVSERKSWLYRRLNLFGESKK